MKRPTTKKHLKPILLLLTAGWIAHPHAQTQLGDDIDGEMAGDKSGHSVAIDGKRIAIGAYRNDGSRDDAGHVRVYEWSDSTWTQLGDDIDGEKSRDNAGYSIALDGDRLAIGAPGNSGAADNAGHVRVYTWNGSKWKRLGRDIDGEAADDLSGWSVALSGDRLAIGIPYKKGYSDEAGHVRTYQWTDGKWIPLGSPIEGEAVGDDAGLSIAIDGDRLAIGAPFNQGNGAGAGHVRVYQWSGSAWIQLGADIDGEAAGDHSGHSVALDGDRLAIGAPDNKGNGVGTGHVRVYQWSGSTWTQLGADIDGEAVGDYSGRSVALDGDHLAVGVPSGNSSRGYVRLYTWTGSTWSQLGANIEGEAAGDHSGHSVALDSDRLIIGAPDNKGKGHEAGHVRVYQLPSSPR